MIITQSHLRNNRGSLLWWVGRTVRADIKDGEHRGDNSEHSSVAEVTARAYSMTAYSKPEQSAQCRKYISVRTVVRTQMQWLLDQERPRC